MNRKIPLFKICLVTGSRAEYGLLRPLLEEFKNDEDIELQLIATGMHLSCEFGLTYKDIIRDGFAIDEKIEILMSSDTSVGVANAMGLAMIGFAKAYQRLKPDLIVVLGDRFEIFSAVAAASVSKIAVAHLYGGDVTEGSFDDYFRHSITKMSHLHFTSTEVSRKKVIQLGERPKRVFNVGAIGLDSIKGLKLLPKEALEKKLHFKFNKYNLLVTFHPPTLEKDSSRVQFQNLLDTLDELKQTKIIFTKANADPEGRTINKMIDKYVFRNSHRVIAFTSMGQLNYLSTMRFVNAIVGNSSSGIVEAPSFKIGTINIGDRQTGRTKAKSVIDCKPTKEEIKRSLDRVFSREFKATLKYVKNPYKKKDTAKNIKDIIKSSQINLNNILKKGFFNIEHRF